MTSLPVRAARRGARRLRLESARLRHAVGERVSPAEALQRAVGGDVAAAVADFRSHRRARFFFDAGDRDAIVSAVERARPGWREATVAAGERICAGEVNLFGRAARHDPTRRPWHEDPERGYRWDARTFHGAVPIPYGRADAKVPWELSRCQHLPALGLAHAASGDDRFAAAVTREIDSWIDANPVGRGVNWASPMEVAIRAVNWLWAYELVAGAEPVDDAFVERLLASLLAHGRHVSANVERYDGITTNHTLADAVGLLYLGTLLPQLADAAAWRADAMNDLAECIEQQVHPDGVDYESSIPYHRFVLELLLGARVLCERNGVSWDEHHVARLQRMFEFVDAYTRPDGLAPLVGDNDDGRLQILGGYFDWEPRDHRYLLAAGGVLFDRDDLADAGSGAPDAPAEVSWLLGPDAWDRVERRGAARRERRSVAFPAGGRYILRTADAHLVVCADEVGTAGLGNHKHNDILSFELSVDGVAMVVDPGVATYTSDRADRDEWRSTRSHNTVVVDGAEQNDLDGWFSMRQRAEVSVLRFDDRDLVVEAEHTGFSNVGVVHRRRLELGREPFSLVVTDTLEGSGAHVAVSYLHFAPGTTLASEPAGYAAANDGVALVVRPVGDVQARLADARFAPRYGTWVGAPVLELEVSFADRVQLGYRIERRGAR